MDIRPSESDQLRRIQILGPPVMPAGIVSIISSHFAFTSCRRPRRNDLPVNRRVAADRLVGRSVMGGLVNVNVP